MTHPQGPRRFPMAPQAPPPLAVCLVSVHGDPGAQPGAEEAGGQNIYVREVARALAARGHHVDVFTRGRTCGAPEASEDEGVRVIRIPAGPTGFIPRAELFHVLPEFHRGVMRWARRGGRAYDVVHSNYWLSGWVGMQLTDRWPVPLVHTHHSLGAVKYEATRVVPAEARQRLEVEDALARAAARVVATSPQEVVNMNRLYASRARTAIVPCGVGPAFHPRDPGACRERLGLPPGRPIVAYVGRFDPAKGLETLVEAAALLAPEHRPILVFAGGYDPLARDLREYKRVQALVAGAGLGGRAVFLGRMDHARLVAVYGAADVVVVPSHYESFGMVAIEAMACGTPVVASDVGGLRYSVIHRETGLLVPAHAPQAFADAIGLLLGDAGLRARMGQAGARMVRQHFVWERVAERLEALYRETIHDASPAWTHA